MKKKTEKKDKPKDHQLQKPVNPDTRAVNPMDAVNEDLHKRPEK